MEPTAAVATVIADRNLCAECLAKTTTLPVDVVRQALGQLSKTVALVVSTRRPLSARRSETSIEQGDKHPALDASRVSPASALKYCASPARSTSRDGWQAQ